MTDHATALAEALRETILQLEYLQSTQRKGSTAGVLAVVRNTLAAYEADKARTGGDDGASV